MNCHQGRVSNHLFSDYHPSALVPRLFLLLVLTNSVCTPLSLPLHPLNISLQIIIDLRPIVLGCP